MIEGKFSQFARSPLGLGLTFLAIILVAVLILLFTQRVFKGLIRPAPYIIE